MAAEEDDRRDPTEGFLTRWSRRKREAPEPPAPPAAASPSEPEPDERPRDPETGEPIDEELVRSLPSPDEIGPGSDLSAFMRRGVPEALRRQALRAVWESDPVIRDFVSPALDYAYDYNAPGGAPGYGPLTESDIAQAKDLIAKVFSDSDLQARKPESAPGEEVGDEESQAAGQATVEPIRTTDAPPRLAAPDDPGSDLSVSSKTPVFLAESAMLSNPDEVRHGVAPPSDGEAGSAQAAIHPARRRRGGGATPR